MSWFDDAIDFMSGAVGVERWNKYVGHPLDNMQRDAANYWLQSVRPRFHAYIDANVIPKLEAVDNYISFHGTIIVDNIEHRLTDVADTVFAISDGIQNTEIINYAAKSIILGAIIDMEMRVIEHAESKDWEGIPDTDYDLIQTIDHIVATESLDIAEMEDDIITVKASDGSKNEVLLSKLIGD